MRRKDFYSERGQKGEQVTKRLEEERDLHLEGRGGGGGSCRRRGGDINRRTTSTTLQCIQQRVRSDREEIR